MNHSSKETKLNARTITLIAIMVALSVVLNAIKIYTFPQGGSITLGSMVPVIFVSMVLGVPYGILAGFLFGLLDLILDPFIVHPIQVLLDYFLAFSLLGMGGIFKNNKFLAVTLSIFCRFICSVLSGVIFYASLANGQNPLIYSIIYNGNYLVPELIITMIIFYFLPIERLKKIILR
ncbi:MAG: energy-coupled thiamine transporter ThiT [Oscillospiraceae bacterium]|nr:energy-coupled thiamine transporter ThiT [Oscillospiraceae bacterium]